MWVRPKTGVASAQCARRCGGVIAFFILCLGCIPRAYAGATLLLEEPYSYDGAFAGTGHAAVYLDHVCAASPVQLRPCKPGESGVVLSRYDGIAGYDWIAIPLIPYLYAVDQHSSIPLFADAKLVAFLRDQYRRKHLESLVPDRPDGGTPEGNWYELVGSSYDRTIYGFQIETKPEKDALLIRRFNQQPNRERYNFVRRNCADFVKDVINFYYPHAVHRSIIGDLGVTTPKQIAKLLQRYGRHHPELQSAAFVVPQEPGTFRRSKPIHGVLESVLAAKKYMVPLVALHPYVGVGLLAGHLSHHHFDPARNVMVWNSNRQLDSPMTSDERLAFQNRMDEINQGDLLASSNDETKQEAKTWERLLGNAQPGLDASGQPILRMDGIDDVALVGLSRANILSFSQSPEFAARLLRSRLRQELRPDAARKTSPRIIERDLLLFERIMSLEPTEVALTTGSIQ